MDLTITENQITNKNLNYEIASLKNQLNEERAKNEVSEQELQNSIEGTKKLKRIHKDITASREHESSRLKEALAENQKYRRLINDLRAKEREYE